MSDRIRPDEPGEDDILAAEYVLHLLSPQERSVAEDRLSLDGGFRARVADWTEDLVLLAEDIAPVAPPASIRRRLAGEGAAASTAPADAPARSAAPARKGRTFGGLFSGLLGGGLVAAAAIVLLAVILPQVQAPGDGGIPTTGGNQTYAADVASADGALRVNVRYDATDNVLVIARVSGTVPEGRDLEAWLLTEDQPPHSVGVIPEGEEIRIDVSPFWGQRIPSGSFAVSEEPLGGSPTGLPTGEVLAVAEVSDA